MDNLVLIIIFILLILIFYQDIKYRHIHVLLPALLLAAGFLLVRSYLFINQFFMNALFLGLSIFILVFYMSFKNKKLLNPFTNYFGLGDLFFFIAVAPLFTLYNYVVFYIFSMLFSVLIYFTFKKVITKDTIPLAGFAALLLMAVIVNDLYLKTYHLSLITL